MDKRWGNVVISIGNTANYIGKIEYLEPKDEYDICVILNLNIYHERNEIKNKV